ncbi:fibrinogen-like protein 1 isoform X2 [Macrobrachium nipponense]|uniref:fibrinogen-like protein 1 isoform X2 n=1 Tax=Macrobrachium nipponense TaxID=159736 RepID=UPI0030C8A65A
MNALLEWRLFVLLFVMPSVQSEADRGKTCEADHPYTDGLVVYSELLLGSVKEEITRLMEECNLTKRSGTIITKGMDDCLNTKEGIENDILAMTNEKENLIREMHRLQSLHSTLVQDQRSIKQALEMPPLDCGDIQLAGAKESGLYDIRLNRTGDHVKVLCDLETNGGGWTVFLQRDKQLEPTNFNRSWSDYKEGFGDKNAEFWLGNDFLHILTFGNNPVTLRVETEDIDGNRRWGEWNVFKVDSEEHKYKLTIEKYRNTSNLPDSLDANNGQIFSTWDQDNDSLPEYACANLLGGTGGWWYNNCGYTRPTGNLANIGQVNDGGVYYFVHWCNYSADARDCWWLQSISLKLRRSHYKFPSSLDMGKVC